MTKREEDHLDQQSEAEPEAMGEAQTDEEATTQGRKLGVDQGVFVQSQAELDNLVGEDALLDLVLEIRNKEVLVHSRFTTIPCPLRTMHMLHFWQGYQSGLGLQMAEAEQEVEEEKMTGKNLVKMKDLVDSALSRNVPRLQWHVGYLLGKVAAAERCRAEMSLANEILRQTNEIIARAQRDLEWVHEAVKKHRYAYEKQMENVRWVKASDAHSDRLLFYDRFPDVVRITRLGKRMPHELVALLERGHFVSGNRRIAKEGGPASSGTNYLYWENWGLQGYNYESKNLMKLVDLMDIPIEEWSWISGPPPADLPL